MEIPAEIGVVLIIVFLATELIVNPFFEVFKNKIIVARLRKLLDSGATIRLGRENTFLNKFGLSTGVRSTDTTLWLLKALKTFVKLYVLCIIAWWESSLSMVSITRPEMSVLTRAAWNRTDGSASFASITPHSPLQDEAIEKLLEVDVLERNTLGNYTKSRSRQLELQYFTDCVEDIDDKRFAYFSLLRGSENASDTVCLNGFLGRDKLPLLSFNPNNDNKKNTTIPKMEFTKYIATDFQTIVFEATVTTDEEFLGQREFQGYVALTVFSHFRNGVGWYIYGFVMGPDDEMLRVIAVASTDVSDVKPCSGDQCLGEWKFSQNEVLLPSGDSVGSFDRKFYSNQLESIGLQLHTVAPDGMADKKRVALAWLAETSFSLFKSNERFIDDVMDRLSGDVFFFSDMGRSSETFRAFDEREVTVFLESRTPLVISAVVILFSFAIIGALADYSSVRWYGIKSDILSREALVEVYKSDVMGGLVYGNKLERARSMGRGKSKEEKMVGIGVKDGRGLGLVDLESGRDFSDFSLDRVSWDISQSRLGDSVDVS